MVDSQMHSFSIQNMIVKCATNLRRDFFNIIKEAQTSGEPILIANRQGSNIVLMDEADYNSMINTINILSDPVEYDKIMHPQHIDGQKGFKNPEEMFDSIK